ncbi:3-hydroxyacyl-CoA dehydrogenase NAD-binding domain-containing protein [Sneathiella sp.]|uniref:3-hydroxyacyl-CoA dehydrogenase NAD-binding domain-containing protein n=1 Tax=Sneathiella sp. TaxID=1964365 RepID=UPI0035619990
MSQGVLEKIEAWPVDSLPPKGDYKNWRRDYDADRKILTLFLDKDDSETNVLSSDVLFELEKIIGKVEADLPVALVIRSAKEKGFCAGADIREFKEYSDADIAVSLKKAHDVIDRLDRLDTLTIAVIHGHCLGGGLELALACDKRIGVEKNLQMGFPEILLGLHPGMGGTFRLTELISPVTALEMMLTGRPAHERQTAERGLVDVLTEERHVDAAIRAMISGDVKPRDPGVVQSIMNLRPARSLAAIKMRRMSEKKAPSRHYPAPYALIDLWEDHGGNRDAMQRAEIKSFSKLLTTDTAQNLIRVFFLQQKLKDLSKSTSDIRNIHVIGAGAMGGDIAGWCAMQGFHVTISDQKPDPIGQALTNLRRLCQSKHKSSIETRDAMDRFVPDLDNHAVRQADLVIEAIPENLEIKKKLYKVIEPLMKKTAILASNTSSIPLEDLSKGLKRPQQFSGLHFFNPVSQMMVVEVVRHENTSEEVQNKILSLATEIGKLPVPVTSHPGFLVNRALAPYLVEAIIMLDEGLPKEVIDDAAIAFGMPMGPVELADQVGLDICLDVADMLSDADGIAIAPVPAWFRDKVKSGELGRKTGRGFYHWKSGKIQKSGSSSARSDNKIIDRLILPMLNACVECYRKGVVADTDQLDAAMIFATGFAPFRGGPLHYARTRGIDDVVTSLRRLVDKHGERFTPDNGWKDV